MTRKKKSIVLSLLIVVLAVSVLAAIVGIQLRSSRSVVYDYAADVESVSSYDKVLKVAGGSDFSPFSYLDEQGLPCGHDVELAFALGREMGYRVEVTLGDWTEMQSGILDGTYDLLMTVDYSDERSQIMGYTSPVCLDSYVFFGKNDSLNLSNMQDLQNLRIASLNGGGATDNYLIPLDLMDNTTFYSTQVEAFESVVQGDNDVAIAGYIYGSNIIATLDMDLNQVGTPLYGAAYYLTYDINNTTLGPQLNSALASLEAKGELSRIDEKWTTHYQPNMTLWEFLGSNLQSVLIISLALLLLVLVCIEILVGKTRKREKILRERDQLTGLYNQRFFIEHAQNLIQKEGHAFVLARFDIDNFKGFKNTQGTCAGNQLLSNIGHGIQNQELLSGNIALSGYLGSDFFVLLLRESDYTKNPDLLYEELLHVVEKACPGYALSFRMGLCQIDSCATDISQVCDQTLVALRSIKNDYYRHWTWFNASISQKMDAETEITSQMYPALTAGQFVPYFHPQFDYATGKLCGAEILARWIKEDGTVVQPSAFIPIFEKNGFIYEMDKVLWAQGCACLQKWKKEGLSIPHLSINISRAEIYHSDLVDTIDSLVSSHGLTMDQLHLEITESSYLESSALLMDTVRKLKDLGAYIEIDDFGSGYSSLSSLKEIQADLIKLDMSLLENNTLEGKDAALLRAIVQLCNSMGTDILAEGVEEKTQAEFLRSLGCNKMQGYLFSKPLNQEEFEKLLKKHD